MVCGVLSNTRMDLASVHVLKEVEWCCARRSSEHVQRSVSPASETLAGQARTVRPRPIMTRASLLLPALVVLPCGTANALDQEASPVITQQSALATGSAEEQIYTLAVAALFAGKAPDSLVLDSVDAPSPPVAARTTFRGSPILDKWSTAQKDRAREALEAIEGATPNLVLLHTALEASGIRVLDGAAVPPPSFDDAMADFNVRRTLRLRVFGIGFSSDSTTAAVFAWDWCGALCGAGTVILLSREPTGTWALLNKYVAWVS